MNAVAAPRDFGIPLLIVDDSRAMQAIIRRVLESSGIGDVDILTVGCGDDALKVLPGFMPQLVITDMHMPSMSGIELLQALRQSGARHVPVGFVTTETSAELIDQAQASGASFVLNKPFRDEDLVRVVREALRGSQPPPGDGMPPALQGLRALLDAQLPGLHYQIDADEKFGPQQMSPKNLLALYEAQGSGIRAIGVANVAAARILGAQRDTTMPGPAVDAQPEGMVAQRAIGFFREAVDLLPTLLPGLEAVRFKGANFMPAEFDKLRAALSAAKDRADFKLVVQGLGEGHFAFIRT